MQTRVSHPFTTPLAAPPPPLNLVSTNQGRGNANLPAFAGARHTLGPTFSEEEDGDDSQFIAEKMAHLGLDKLGVPRGIRRPEQDRRPYTPPSHGSRRTRKRQADYEAHLAQMHAVGREQNISPPLQTGPTWNQRAPQDLLNQMQHNEAYLALQHQARIALLAAQMQQPRHDEYVKKSHDPYYNQSHHMSVQQQQQRLFALQQSQIQQGYLTPSDHRDQLAAQVQANLLARTRRQKNLDDAETRARFESVPNTTSNLRSPFGTENAARVSPFARGDSMWSASPATPSTPSGGNEQSNAVSFGQFSRQVSAPQSQPTRAPVPNQAGQAPKTAQGPGTSSLSALLSRRGQPASSTDLVRDTSVQATRAPLAANPIQSSPTALTPNDSGDKPEAKDARSVQDATTAIRSLGLGRPKTNVSNLAAQRPTRAWSTPANPTSVPTTAPRSASQPNTSAAVHAVRQPFGPPGNMDRLKEENFKSLLRKRAGLKLGMLNRRVSPSTPCVTLEEETDGDVEARTEGSAAS